MAVNFHQGSVFALFDATPVPLLTFGVNGEVTYANRAATVHPGRPLEAMNGHTVIRSLVADATLGKLKLPYRAEIEVAGGQRLSGTFMPGPAGLDIAFVGDLPDSPAGAAGGSSNMMQLKDIIEMLRDEVGPHIQHLRAQLKALDASPANKNLDHAALGLSRRLQRLAELVEVFGEDVLRTQDRIELPEVFDAVRGELASQAAELGVHIELQLPVQTLPPIYGNERLIQRALYECLDNALIHSRKQVNGAQSLKVEVRFNVWGEHVLVSVRNQGATGIKLSGNDTLNPFVAPPPKGSAEESTVRLGLPLVQRIVGLHGGQMRVSTADADTVQVLLEFPTGAPQRGQKDLSLAQAQRYAQDLAQLMSRRKKEKA
jgi:hypothetical protein